VVFSATPNAGFQVANWSIDVGNLTGANTDTIRSLENIQGPVTVTVEFEAAGTPPPVTHTVQFSVVNDTGGSLSATVGGVDITSPAQVAEGEDVVFTATPNAGFQVANWSIDVGSLTGANTAAIRTAQNIQAPITVTVEFEAIVTPPPITHSVQFSVRGGTGGSLAATVGGVNILSSAQVLAGTTVVFTATPAVGFRVASWEITGASLTGANSATVRNVANLQGPIVVTVVFESIVTPPPGWVTTGPLPANRVTVRGIPENAFSLGPTWANRWFFPTGGNTNNQPFQIPPVSAFFVLNPGWELAYVRDHLGATLQPGQNTLLMASGGTLIYTFRHIPGNIEEDNNIEENGNQYTPTPPPATTPPEVGTAEVQFTQSDGDVTLVLSDSAIQDIIQNAADGSIDFDLSGANNAISAIMPISALNQFANAGLNMEIKLPQGAVQLDNNAMTLAAEQADGETVDISIRSLQIGDIPEYQRQYIRSDDLIFAVIISSQQQRIAQFNGGIISITVAYSGPLPVAVWHLGNEGQKNRIESTFNAQDSTVTFTTSRLSVFIVGYDAAPAAVSAPQVPDFASFVNPFMDVRTSDWFYSQVAFVYLRGLMTGTSLGQFSPDMTATRAMAAQMLYNLHDRPDTYGLPNPFSDIAADSWYHNAVIWAADKGLVGGFADGTFRPDDNITRAHLAVILDNYAQRMEIELPILRETAPFADYADIRSYARPSINALFKAMVLNGRPDGSFDPNSFAARAELAAILQRFLEVVNGINGN
jgi:hypothetical protein